MLKSMNRLNLLQVNDESSIPAIVRTINSSFSSDPLVQWLRPNGVPWAKSEDSAWRWQYRRVQATMLKGNVFQAPLVSEMVASLPVQQRKESALTTERETESPTLDDSPSVTPGLDDAGAVLLLFPPKCQLKWSVTRLWRAVKLFVFDTLWPARDKGAVDSRVTKLLKANKRSSDSLNAKYSTEKLWYLEVIAVHPSLQSRGLGGKVMGWLLDHINDQPIYLDCTRKENLRFYQGFGFRVVEEIELVEDDQKLTYWVMVRPGKNVVEDSRCRNPECKFGHV